MLAPSPARSLSPSPASPLHVPLPPVAGLQLQYDASVQAVAKAGKLRHSARAANERADGAATAAREAQVSVGAW